MKNKMRVLLLCFFSALTQATTIEFIAEELPPYHFLDQQGTPSGGLVDIAKAAAHDAGMTAKFTFMPMARVLHALQTDPEVVVLSWLKTPNRTARYNFLGTVCHASASLLGLKTSDIHIKNLDAAKKYRTSTIRGYYSEQFLRNEGFSEEYELVLVSQYETLWQLLYKGRTDLVLTNTMSIQKELNALGLDPALIEEKLILSEFPQEVAMVVNQGFSKSTADALSRGLENIKRSGLHREILNKWQLK
ncbi:substrate-binding periplasmic protein [Pseudoalteromonas sp. T1lg65]|uniref:substrate-binding periplasmic protein n=1 Tax=Pseudoalteromonas sp. T1lg65 TaxID=2077101 RepID=UPI003F7B0E25